MMPSYAVEGDQVKCSFNTHIRLTSFHPKF